MALFEFTTPSSTRLDYLRDYHTFGRRSDVVDTILHHAYISKLHAVIEWRAPNWLLKDVSRNGLKLNNKILPAQKPVVLSVGDIIDFGCMDEVLLKILDLDPPKSMLVSEKLATDTIEINDSTLLPNEEAPELALYLCPDRQQWFSEEVHQGVEKGPFDHGDILNIGGSHWRFFLISEDMATTEFSVSQTSINDVMFRFDLSQDEESTSLTLINSNDELDLGERSHHYLLVHLLRHRISQSDGAGWLDSQLLMKELGLEEAHINIQIFRARKQLAEALPGTSGHSKFIERRRGALRVGLNLFEIYKEGVKEA